MIKNMNKRKAYVAVIGVIVALSGIWLYAQKSKPSVIWTPKSVIEIVQPNVNKTVNISFKANTNLNGVTFFLASAIRDVVSVSPTGFTGVSANNVYPVAINIHPGSISQVKYSGTVQLKDTMGYATNALPLPVTVVVHNEPVPPDPGEAGKQTLEGIDSDNDGVRDDIQRYIILNYYNTQKTQLALRQYAKALQPFLLDAEDKQLSRAHTKEMDEAQNCSHYIFGLDEAERITDELIAQFLNTDLRSRTYIKADSQLSGMSGSFETEQIKSGCTFNPDTLEN